MWTVITAVVALASLASATVPTTQVPSGLSILRPGLHEKVPVGKPYTITWDRSECGPVTILFLKGPATNVIPVGTVVAGTPNVGSYEGWVPAADLPDSTEGYALQIICDKDGTYQWSTQFGFSNLGVTSDKTGTTTPATVSTTVPTTTAPTTIPHTTPITHNNTTEPAYPTSSPVYTSDYGNITISATEYPTSSGNGSYPTKHHYPTHNVTTTTKPTKKPTKKPEYTSSVEGSSEPSSYPESTAPSAPTHTASGAVGIAASSGMALVALVVVGFTLF